MMKQGEEAVEVLLITPDQMPGLLQGVVRGITQAVEVHNLISRWLAQMCTRRGRDNSFLCASCERDFAEDSPDALVIMIPVFDRERGALVSGVCQHCYATKCEPSRESFIMMIVRKKCPDAREIPVSSTLQ